MSVWSVQSPELWCGQEDLWHRLQFFNWIEQASHVSSSHLSFYRQKVCMLCCVRLCICSYYSVCFIISLYCEWCTYYLYVLWLFITLSFVFVYSRLSLLHSTVMHYINMLIIIVIVCSLPLLCLRLSCPLRFWSCTFYVNSLSFAAMLEMAMTIFQLLLSWSL